MIDEQTEKKSLVNGNPSPSGTADGEGTSSGVLRRPSKRQQEKAPEGTPPRTSLAQDGAAGEGTSAQPTTNTTNGLANGNGNAHGPGESRFTEVVGDE